MGAESWPPPVDDATVWQEVVTLDRDGERVPVKVRPARLWAQRVLIDAAGDVWCDGCAEMIPVAVLGRRGNTHRVGLFRGQMVPPMTPMPTGPDDGEGRMDPPPGPWDPWPA